MRSSLLDATRFDTLTRTFSTVGSRRRAVALALGGAIGLRGLLDPEMVEAHNVLASCKKKKGKQKKKCLKKAKQHNAQHAADGGTGGDGATDGGDTGGGDSGLCPNVDLQNDVNNCGVCGHKCEFPNARSACERGTCMIAECNSGFADCDPNAAGCEAELGTPEHCSGCFDICGGVPNATSTCQVDSSPGPGTCVDTCNPGTDCDGDGNCECNAGETCTPAGGPVGSGTRGCDGGGCVCIPNTETQCSDGIDNDGDGNTDQADSDCPPVLQSVTVRPNNVPIGTATSLGTVQLSRSVISDTSVTLSLDKTNASVPGSVTVANGQSSATFPVDGISPSGDPVTLSATLGTVIVTETFYVIN